MKKNIFGLLIISLILITTVSLSEIKLIKLANVNDKIITNIDLQREIKLIKILNNIEDTTSDSNIEKFALENIINEILKEEELNKNEIEIDKKIVNEYYNNLIYQLKNKNLNISKDIDKEIYKKILLEYKWNQLISKKFSWKININMNEINEKLKNNVDDENRIISLKNELITKEKNKKLEIYSLNYLANLRKNSLIKYFK